MDNALQQVTTIRNGVMFGAIDPERKLPHTATRDTIAAAARLLRDRSWEGQEDVPVLGPEELSYGDLAATISEAIGREVSYQHLPFERLDRQLRERGMNPAFVRAYVDMLRAKDESMDNVAPRASAIIGHTSFRRWAEDELKTA